MTPAWHRGTPGRREVQAVRPRLRRPVRPRLRHPVRSVGIALVAFMAAGCAGVPAASSPRIIEPVPKGGLTEEPDVRFQPISPRPGEPPREVVQDFLAAAGSPEREHGIARHYLTPRAAGVWRDDAGAVVLSSRPLYLEERAGGSQIVVRGDEIGRVDSAGVYLPVSEAYSQTFDLERVDGEWRIGNPPPGVIVPAVGFEQAYRRLNLYFLDDTGTRVVPDPRWFSAPRESLPNLLLRALLNGPSDALRGAVRTRLGPGITMTGNVVPDNDAVRVYLSGIGDLGTAARAAASAQIVWTLNQLGTPGVEVFDDGQALRLPGLDSVQHLRDWRRFDPDSLAVDTTGYFLRNGALWTTDGRPVSGPVGRGTYRAVSVGISPSMTRVAVVGRTADGVALYVGGLRSALSVSVRGTSLSPPTWGGTDDEVWTVRNGTEVLRIASDTAPARVAMPDIDRIGPISVLRLSRDGTRVAIVAGRRGGAQRLYVGTVSRSDDPGVDRLQLVAPGLEGVADVAWSAADSLVVLTRSGTSDAGLSSLAVDGSTSEPVTTSGLPGPPSGLAAAPTLPALTVAEGGVWRLRDPQGTWSSVQRGGAGSLADSAPAYPG